MSTFKPDGFPTADEDTKEPDLESKEKEKVSDERFPMPDEYRGRLLELGHEAHAEAYTKVIELVNAFEKAGGRALLVGGSVRDVVFGKLSKDFDLEVYGLEAEEIERVVQDHGCLG